MGLPGRDDRGGFGYVAAFLHKSLMYTSGSFQVRQILCDHPLLKSVKKCAIQH
jgi:hypothetical protein